LISLRPLQLGNRHQIPEVLVIADLNLVASCIPNNYAYIVA
jgi:hypothetical protein